MLLIDGTARLVSDLHLRNERPDLTGRFFSFLDDTAAAKVAALFILGDLFEYWIGDDDLDDPFNASIAQRLATLRQAGTRIFFLTGNRDFLVGSRFSAATGIELLDEETCVQIRDARVGAGIDVASGQTAVTSILLMHGDTLCLDDKPYQEFRQLVRSEAWQSQFLARSLAERRAEVAALRKRSAEAMQAKTAAIMDVNESAVIDAAMRHQCARLIHGHTHRPGHHPIASTPPGERWVLSDWDSGRGDALEINGAPALIRRLDLSGLTQAA
jgi:UDP-2,3-diacylglucosamine hydrolase